MRIDHRRLVIVLISATALFAALVFYRWVEITHDYRVALRFAESPDKLDARLKWGDEFDFWHNNYDWLTSVRGETIIAQLFFNVCCWFLLHTAVWLFFRAISPTQIYNKLALNDAWFLGQKVPSTIHAIGVGALAFKILFIDREFETDIIMIYTPLCDAIIGFSYSYEIYDILVMYMQTGASIPMYFHHFSLCAAYTLAIVHRKLAFVAVAMLLTELTVIPSNLHYYLKIYGFKRTRLFHFNQAIRLYSFILIRLPVPIYVYYMIYTHYDRFQHEVWVARYACYVIVTFLFLMNLYWTKVMTYLYLNRKTLAEEIASYERKNSPALQKKNNGINNNNKKKNKSK